MTKFSSAGAAPATYRKAVNGIADALGKDPVHSKYPGSDFEDALDSIPEELKKKALEWYERGIKRGMAHATDLMASGDIKIADGVVTAPVKMKLKVRTRFQGEDWVSREVTIKSVDIGFKTE